MPEITFDDLPQLLKENKEIRSQIHMKVNHYIQTYHPKGWNRIDDNRRGERSADYFASLLLLDEYEFTLIFLWS